MEMLDMEDPIQTARELATHANDIKHLQQDMDKMVADMDEIKRSLAGIQKTLSEAKGGWRTLMAVAGVASVLSGGFVWLIDKFWR
jgi:predicted secreted protein